ncbi:MAG TPA: ribonuclease H [Candidatus Glassbacteria bacterium]|nr:ribonuclease H [Candidatus Glassbacteria bacterium]
MNYIWCDGGCRNNQEKNNIGGYGVIIKENDEISEYRGAELNTTNNKQELTSLVVGLSKIKNKDAPLEVIMDSRYVVMGITEWSKKWMLNGFKDSKNKEIKNRLYWIYLIPLVAKFKDIKFVLCKGHGDNAGNERADKLANIAMDELGTRLIR